MGEALAARAARAAGWRVLARRLATAHGEVDLVLARGAWLACVEVKTGRADFGVDGRPDGAWRPGLRADRRRAARLERAARALARSCAAVPRVDLVEVFVERGGRRCALQVHEHFRGELGPALPRAGVRPAWGSLAPGPRSIG